MDQAEKLRKMVNLNNTTEKGPGAARIITVTSGKGGVGKSTTSVNIATEFGKRGKKVIIFDADFGLANVEIMLGIRPMYNLADMLFKGRSINDIITPWLPNVSFISGGSGIQELAKLSKEQISFLTGKLTELDKLADIIVIDTGAGIQDSVIEFVAASEEVVLIATPEPTSITDAYAVLKTLNKKEGFSADSTSIRLIANRAKSKKNGEEIFEKLDVVSKQFLNIELDYLGAVLDDESAQKAIIRQKPVILAYPNSDAAKAYVDIVDKLCDEENNQSNIVKKGFSAFLADVFKGKRIR